MIHGTGLLCRSNWTLFPYSSFAHICGSAEEMGFQCLCSLHAWFTGVHSLKCASICCVFQLSGTLASVEIHVQLRFRQEWSHQYLNVCWRNLCKLTDDSFFEISSWRTGLDRLLASLLLQFVSDVTKYISGCMASLSAMIQLELPHINVLTKVDLLPNKRDIDR